MGLKVYAYCVEAERTYVVELNRRGYNIQENTNDDKIWSIARREMRASFGKPVTAWCFSS